MSERDDAINLHVRRDQPAPRPAMPRTEDEFRRAILWAKGEAIAESMKHVRAAHRRMRAWRAVAVVNGVTAIVIALLAVFGGSVR